MALVPSFVRGRQISGKYGPGSVTTVTAKGIPKALHLPMLVIEQTNDPNVISMLIVLAHPEAG